jgi:hypothetical protein
MNWHGKCLYNFPVNKMASFIKKRLNFEKTYIKYKVLMKMVLNTLDAIFVEIVLRQPPE